MSMSMGRLSVLIIDRDISSPLWAAPFPGQVILGCIKNLADQESAHEQVRSLLPWFLLLEFLL